MSETASFRKWQHSLNGPTRRLATDGNGLVRDLHDESCTGVGPQREFCKSLVGCSDVNRHEGLNAVLVVNDDVALMRATGYFHSRMARLKQLKPIDTEVGDYLSVLILDGQPGALNDVELAGRLRPNGRRHGSHQRHNQNPKQYLSHDSRLSGPVATPQVQQALVLTCDDKVYTAFRALASRARWIFSEKRAA